MQIFFKSGKKIKRHRFFTNKQNEQKQKNLTGDKTISTGKFGDKILWIDALNPTDEQLKFLENHHDLKLAPKVKTSLEGSERNYQDKKGLHIHLYFLRKKRLALSLTSVSFILKNNILFSLRNKEATVLRLIGMKLKASENPDFQETDFSFLEFGEDLLLWIFEENIDFFADKLEDLYEELNEASANILKNSDQDLNLVLNIINKIEDENSKIRLCLLDAQRAMSFLQRNLFNAKENNTRSAKILEINRDIDSLLSHTNFVFEKLNFLLNSAQGFININQNKIIKIFSIMSLMFMPPTLIASIYGMNFEFMPELANKYAYPLVLAFMLISAYLPYRWFKHKKWL